MLRLTDVKDYLLTQFPTAMIYNGFLDYTKPQCLGLFHRQSNPVMAVGGVQNSSYNILSVSIIVHWGEDSDACEVMADDIYSFLEGKVNVTINGKNIRFISMNNGGPIDISRDERNICEMVIHADFYYER